MEADEKLHRSPKSPDSRRTDLTESSIFGSRTRAASPVRRAREAASTTSRSIRRWFTSEQINLEEDGARACGRSGAGIEPASRAVASRYSGSRDHESLSSAFRLESLSEEVGRRQMHRRTPGRTPGAYPVPSLGSANYRRSEKTRTGRCYQRVPEPFVFRVYVHKTPRRADVADGETLFAHECARPSLSPNLAPRMHQARPRIVGGPRESLTRIFLDLCPKRGSFQPTRPRAKSCINLLY